MAQVQRITFLKTSLKDQPGTLSGIMQNLKSKNIGLKGLWGYGKEDGTAELFIIPKDAAAVKSLWTAAGLTVEEGTVFFLTGSDKTGVLLKKLAVLTTANVNIKAMNALAVEGKYGSVIWVDAADVDKAAKALEV